MRQHIWIKLEQATLLNPVVHLYTFISPPNHLFNLHNFTNFQVSLLWLNWASWWQNHNLNHCLDFNVQCVVMSSTMFLQFWKDRKIRCMSQDSATQASIFCSFSHTCALLSAVTLKDSSSMWWQILEIKLSAFPAFQVSGISCSLGASTPFFFIQVHGDLFRLSITNTCSPTPTSTHAITSLSINNFHLPVHVDQRNILCSHELYYCRLLHLHSHIHFTLSHM